MNHVHRLASLIKLLMSVMQARRHLGHDMNRHAQRQRGIDFSTALDDSLQIATVHVLHGEVEIFPFPAQLVNLNDIWMVETGRNSAFVQKHVGRIWRIRHVRKHPFDRDFLRKPTKLASLLGEEDLGHAARGHFFDEFVFTECFAHFWCHPFNFMSDLQTYHERQVT